MVPARSAILKDIDSAALRRDFAPKAREFSVPQEGIALAGLQSVHRSLGDFCTHDKPPAAQRLHHEGCFLARRQQGGGGKLPDTGPNDGVSYATDKNDAERPSAWFIERSAVIGDWMAGAQGRNRTTDTAIFSRMLYQLSYLGVARRAAD